MNIKHIEYRKKQDLRNEQYLDLLARVATHGYLYVYIQNLWKECVELFYDIKNYRCLTNGEADGQETNGLPRR